MTLFDLITGDKSPENDFDDAIISTVKTALVSDKAYERLSVLGLIVKMEDNHLRKSHRDRKMKIIEQSVSNDVDFLEFKQIGVDHDNQTK